MRHYLLTIIQLVFYFSDIIASPVYIIRHDTVKIQMNTISSDWIRLNYESYESFAMIDSINNRIEQYLNKHQLSTPENRFWLIIQSAALVPDTIELGFTILFSHIIIDNFDDIYLLKSKDFVVINKSKGKMQLHLDSVETLNEREIRLAISGDTVEITTQKVQFIKEIELRGVDFLIFNTTSLLIDTLYWSNLNTEILCIQKKPKVNFLILDDNFLLLKTHYGIFRKSLKKIRIYTCQSPIFPSFHMDIVDFEKLRNFIQRRCIREFLQ